MSASERLTRRTLNRSTLARQLLLARGELTPRVALEHVSGVQAQWPKPPFVGLWSRLGGFERDHLADLLRRRHAVRATMMRGTIHVVTAKEYVALRGVLQPALTRGLAAIRERSANLDMKGVLDAARELFETPRTFEEVRDALVARFPNAHERAMGFVARMMLPLVMVPTDDPWAFPSVARFQLAESWLRKPMSANADPSALVLRYFASFGPATIADAQAWSGLQGLRAVVNTLRPKLTSYRDERGRELFDVANASLPDEDTPAPVRFLQEFDNVLMGYQDRSRVLADEHRSFVLLPGLRVASTVLVDGFIAATWKVERAKQRATMAIQLLTKIPKRAEKEVEEEAERLARFLEPDAGQWDLRWT